MERIYIDVREPQEYATGHAKGAINIPLQSINFDTVELNKIDKDTELIVYCQSGARASIAVQLMKSMGYKNVLNGINQQHLNIHE